MKNKDGSCILANNPMAPPIFKSKEPLLTRQDILRSYRYLTIIPGMKLPKPEELELARNIYEYACDRKENVAEAVPFLKSVLGHPSAYVRFFSGMALELHISNLLESNEKEKGESALAFLSSSLSEETSPVHIWSLNFLRFNPRAITRIPTRVFIDMFGSPSTQNQQFALVALETQLDCKCDISESIPALVSTVLNLNADPSTRLPSANLLNTLSKSLQFQEYAILPLVNLLSEERVRFYTSDELNAIRETVLSTSGYIQIPGLEGALENCASAIDSKVSSPAAWFFGPGCARDLPPDNPFTGSRKIN
ncbi:MAG: hypothetical protein WC488_00865 [Candidatus Micrarchaeia archaeon]